MTSATLYRLTDFGERLFWRLTLIADDFGRYEGDAQVIKAKCFPLWPDKRLSLTRIVTSYAELEAADLVRSYLVDGKRYGFFVTWEKYQQRRANKSKFPEPTEDNVLHSAASVCVQLLANVPEKREARSEESRSDLMSGSPPDGARNGFGSESREVLTWLNAKASKNFRPVPANLTLIEARLRDGISPAQLRAIVTRKVREWAATDQAKYLRPETLFNRTKCEQYVGELPKVESHAD